MNKLKILAAVVIFVFALSSANMFACDKTASNSKSCCSTKAKNTSCETSVKKTALKESKEDCDTKTCSDMKSCSDKKTASLKNSKGSCCTTSKDTKVEAKNETSEVKTVAETPNK